MDNVERAIWNDVEMYDCGCWTWRGPKGCNVVRLLADLGGTSLPTNIRIYRMPDCEMGAECVNPDHVGTSEQWMARVRRSKTR